MTINSIGLIYNAYNSQASINLDHAKAIGRSLSGYKVSYYNISDPQDVEKLIHDRKAGKLDIVFNNSAGKKGGDGSVEGFLDILGIPYIGSDVLATAAAFDKKTTKSVVADHGVPIIRGLTFTKEQFTKKRRWVIKQIEEFLKYPVVVKASQGSDSIGVSLVRKPEQILEALQLAFHEDSQVIVEDFIKRLAEVTCFVMGNGDEAVALEPVERVYEGDILYDVEKLERSYRLPTTLSQRALERIKAYSIAAHNALGCFDYSRTDFLVNKSGSIYFLELNAHAGLGAVGPSAYAAKMTYNWNHKRFMNEIVKIAAARYTEGE